MNLVTELMYSEIAKGRFLTREEEQILIKKAQMGSSKARDLILRGNMRMVLSTALKFKNIGTLELPDLVNTGAIGIIRAIDSFDVSLGVKFMTHAIWWVKAEISSYIREHSSTVRIPANQRQLIIKALRESKNPNAEISDDVKELLNTAKGGLSFDNVVPNTSEWENKKTYSEIIPSNSNTYQETEDNIRSEKLEIALNGLDGRESEIVKMSFGLTSHPHTLDEISREMKISKERVRQIKQIAIKKLRKGNRELMELI